MLSRVCLRTPRVEELGSSGWGKWQYAHRSSLWQPSVDVCNTHGSQVPSACAARSASAGWGQLQANANFQVPGLCHPLSSKPGPKRSFYFAGFLASICNLKLETSESQKSQKCCHEMYTYKAKCAKNIGPERFSWNPTLVFVSSNFGEVPSMQ